MKTAPWRPLGQWYLLAGPCLAGLLLGSSPALAEGSWQFGLSEGATHAQPLFEYDNSYASDSTGLQAQPRPLYVDLLADNEVINISVCGTDNSDAIGIEIWDAGGVSQLASIDLPAGNVSCADAFTGPLATPYQFSPGAAGTYQLRLFNDAGNGDAGVFERFDVTVTQSAGDPVDPRLDQGRLWALRWAFRCTASSGCFGADYATSADLFAVVDGGFANGYYVWQLDLDNFAGYAYEITANSIGLDSPNPDGTVVAALSACIDSDGPGASGCGTVSGNRNSVAAVYPIYTSDPALPYPRPTETPRISNFRFLDDAGVDDSISPNDTITIQDTGDFLFTTNLVTEGTYTITIDVTADGDFGAGDVVLSGIAEAGDNTVNWNGRDNSGGAIPNGSYNAQIVLKTGEFHFTAADAETSGGSAGPGLTINAVLDDGTVDDSNLVFWDDATILGLTGATAYNAEGNARFHNWGNFTGGGDGNRAYIDTFVVGAYAAPVLTQLEVEPIPSSDRPKTPMNGTVFEDLDGDGVQGPGEPGLANVVIAITEQRIDNTQFTFFVTTDENGDYRAFTRAPTVTVDVDETTLPVGYTRTAGTDPDVVAIAAGVDNALGNDGFRATLASVSGEVRLDSDGNGDPADSDSGLAGVSVVLYSDPNGDGDPADGAPIDSTVSAADGRFSFNDVPLGDYVVVSTDLPGYSSSGESDDSADNRIAIARVANNPIADLLFLDTLAASDIIIDARAVCIQDAPWVEWDITPVNFTPSNLATVEWIDADGNVVRTDSNQPLENGRLLWPGAAVDGSGNGVAWPGWQQVNGSWEEIPSTVRPQVTLRISVNPTQEVTLTYPPATIDCAAAPLFVASAPPAVGAAGGRVAVGIPALPGPALLLLILLTLAGARYGAISRR